MTGGGFTSMKIPIASPAGCVLVRVRQQNDPGSGYVLGWFALDRIDGLLVLLSSRPFYFGESGEEADFEGATVQLVAEAGAVCVEIVCGVGE